MSLPPSASVTANALASSSIIIMRPAREVRPRHCGILAANRRLKGGAAYNVVDFMSPAASLPASLTDNSRSFRSSGHRRGVEFVMFKANGAHLFCLKRSFPCQTKAKNPASTQTNRKKILKKISVLILFNLFFY